MFKKFILDNKYIILMLTVAGVYALFLRFCCAITPSFLETIAVVFTIIEFDLFRRQKSSAFAFNIIRCVLLVIWFLSIGLYGQVAFRILTIIGSTIGMLIWIFPSVIKQKKLEPSFLSDISRIVVFSSLMLFGLIMMFSSNMIESMDWIYFACGLIGNLLILFKKKEAWVLWLAMDLIGLPLFFLSGSWMYLLMTVFMIGVEIAALKSWRVKNDKK